LRRVNKMRIKEEKNYEFYNPADTKIILFKTIKKEGSYEFNRRKNKEERRDWWYKNTSDFSINLNLMFGKLFPRSKEEDDDKDKYLNLIRKEAEKLNRNKIFKEIFKRLCITIEELKRKNFKISDPIKMTLTWRMIIGLGGVHPHETSMTFHHIYGIPYIPGSAVKGVTRHWVVWKCFENKEDEALKKDEDFKNIFGTQEEQGKVIFFDAYPEGEIKLAVDIMNPHYSDYYSEGKPPADWQKPKPIPFLTVEDTKFCFFLASKEDSLLKKAESWLKEALKEYGIGAKTALGYGIFAI